MFCKFCGKQLSDNMNFCNYCGRSIIVKKIEETKTEIENPEEHVSSVNKQTNPQ